MDKLIPVVRAIIKNEKGEILLLKRANTKNFLGEWNLPGGKINQGETPKEACLREVKEETGLDVLDLKQIFEHTNTLNGKDFYHIYYFKVNFSGNVKINEESSDFKWCNKENINNLKIAFAQQDIVLGFYEQQ